MDIRKAIHELRQEQERLDTVIAALEARQTGPRSRRGRKSVPPEERAQMSKRMTAYWAARRAQGVTAAATMSETGPPSPQCGSWNRPGTMRAADNAVVTAAHETATAAEEMTAQMQTTRRHIDELVAVVGLRNR